MPQWRLALTASTFYRVLLKIFGRLQENSKNIENFILDNAV